MQRLFTSESVTEGHPDKVCDQIADAVLDAILKEDTMARVACEQLKDAEALVTDGLRRLGTDYLDILMIHWPTKDRELLIENLQTLERLREKGYIRALGVSNFGVETLKIAKSLGLKLVADELAYSLISRAIEYDILPLCRENGIGVTAYMPLMQGILTGKYKTVEEIPEPRRRSVHFNSAKSPMARHGGPGFEDETMAVVRGVCDIAQSLGTDAATVALAWTIAQEGVASAMVGCRNAAQAEQNARAAEFVLPPDALSELDCLTAPLKEKLPRNPDLFAQGAAARVW